MNDSHMPSKVSASTWRTAMNLHQVQLLSCDLCDFKSWDSPDHCAPFWRLYWHDGIGGEITLGEKTLPIRPGHLVLIPPNTHFGSRLHKPFRQLFLHFLVEPRFRGAAGEILQFKADREQRACCRKIAKRLCTDSSDLGISLLGQILISQALLQLPLQAWAPRYADSRITEAIEAIAKAYPARLSNARLARAAGMHPSAFTRLFRSCTGHTPLQHLLQLRLEEACTLLHYDESSLEQIAEKTGFGDRGYFTRIFSRSMNCPPARYRKLVNVSGRLRPKA